MKWTPGNKVESHPPVQDPAQWNPKHFLPPSCVTLNTSTLYP